MSLTTDPSLWIKRCVKRLLAAGELAVLDFWLTQLPVDVMDIGELRLWLVLTAPQKRQLPGRTAFWSRCWQQVERLKPGKAPGLIGHLS